MNKNLLFSLKNLKEKEWKHHPLSCRQTEKFHCLLFKQIDFDFSQKKVLEIGCGWGTSSVFLSKFAKEVIGTDVESRKTWVVFKKRNHNLNFMIADGSKLPFKEETFDAVFLKDVLHHIPDFRKSLREFKRVLKKKGSLVIVEPNRHNPIFYLHFNLLRHHYHFPSTFFKSLIISEFPEVKFKHLDLHNNSFNNKFLNILFGFSRIIFEKTPVLNRLSSYIIAVAEK